MRTTRYLVMDRGHSSAGRALEWHSRGRRFDPAWLHHQNRHANGRCLTKRVGACSPLIVAALSRQELPHSADLRFIDQARTVTDTRYVEDLRLWPGIAHALDRILLQQL